MTVFEDNAAGMAAAKAAILAIADGDEKAALDALNATSHAEAVWVAACLLTCVREAVAERVNRRPNRVRGALIAAANGLDEDIVMTQVALVLDEAERGLGLE